MSVRVHCPYSDCTGSVSVYDSDGRVACLDCGRMFDYEVEATAYALESEDANIEKLSDLRKRVKEADLALDEAARSIRRARTRGLRDEAYTRLQTAGRTYRFLCELLAEQEAEIADVTEGAA